MALTDRTKSYLILALALVTFITLITSASINLTTTDPNKRNNTLISQNTVFGFVIICIALIVYLGIGRTGTTTVISASSTPTTTTSFIKNTDTATLIMTALLATGILTSFITTSINLTTRDSVTQKNIFISQAVIFCVVILGLAFTIRSVVGDDIKTMDLYLMTALHAAVLLSVVSLSATIMSKLAQATTAGAKKLATR